MAPELLLTLTLACAPQVHPDTALRLIRHESGGNPYAIGINGPYRLSPQPSSKSQAVATANMLLQAGLSIDMGLGMINSKNLKSLGLSVESVFDPCTNLQAMQTILQAGYSRAVKTHGPGQKSLIAALSEYNTGHPVNGIKNGYVARVFATPVPWVLAQNTTPANIQAGQP
ncbi:lytic transglycosylase domain-containing protein [Limnohabitans radicicola]|uniref:Lytic transglycosylase domain-containing protein n=1 Tax=Limnohabitans radicicola TaxID=2771427 RepID=A0A927ILV2_9BURK|nr:lytic transglycosylase domain-containing protein [Limnohabitans radicicola]MBD8051098.1 lytic transglycosylase domain-containing protein [Limnohabitans radicicola]